MKVEIEMPNLGESIVEGTVIEWHKSVGDTVSKDEELFTISTDKVDTGVPCPKAGVLVEIRAEVDSVVEVGEVVAVIDTEASGDADAESADDDDAEASGGADLQADADDGAEVAEEGDSKEADDGADAEDENDSEDADDSDAESRASDSSDDDGDSDADAKSGSDVRITPVARKMLQEAGISDFAKVKGSGAGGRITKADAQAFVEAEDGSPADNEEDASDGNDEVTSDGDGRTVPKGQSLADSSEDMASQVPQVTKDLLPIARERAARRERDEPPNEKSGQTEPSEQRDSPDKIVASGNGEQRQRDVPRPPMHLLEQLKGNQARSSGPDVVVGKNDYAEPMTGLERSISRSMVQSRQSAAHCSTVWEADVTRIVELRGQLREDYKQRGVKLTYTPFFLAALADGLRRFPVLNASVDGDEIVYRGAVNIGIATPWRESLVVPVIHKADFLNLFGLAKAVNEINRRIREEEVRPSDVENGTFSVTNTGVYGSLFSVPTILQPQVAIMSIGRIAKRVKVEHDDTIRIRSTVHLGLTFDHRIVNFERADSFMRCVVNFLENWESSN